MNRARNCHGPDVVGAVLPSALFTRLSRREPPEREPPERESPERESPEREPPEREP